MDLRVTPDEKLEAIARKLKRLFAPELEEVIVSGGQCPAVLWLLVGAWSEFWPSGTGYIEGINNMTTAAKAQLAFVNLRKSNW